MLIPDNFTDFLFWFKEATETFWAKKGQQLNNEIALPNAKWLGMEEPAIDEIEMKYQIKFPPDFREFLKILHTVDVKPTQDRPFFFNWVEEEQITIDKLNWPYFAISQEVIWLNSWGTKPDSKEAISNRFDKWYAKAPKLIPIFGHRYIVSEPCKSGNPILSVVGYDTIIYGWNLKHYLLHEFSEFMPDELFEKFYDDEDGSWGKDYKDEIQDIFDSNWLNYSYDDIPYWGELIKQSRGSWVYQPRKK